MRIAALHSSVCRSLRKLTLLFSPLPNDTSTCTWWCSTPLKRLVHRFNGSLGQKRTRGWWFHLSSPSVLLLCLSQHVSENLHTNQREEALPPGSIQQMDRLCRQRCLINGNYGSDISSVACVAFVYKAGLTSSLALALQHQRFDKWCCCWGERNEVSPLYPGWVRNPFSDWGWPALWAAVWKGHMGGVRGKSGRCNRSKSYLLMADWFPHSHTPISILHPDKQ